MERVDEGGVSGGLTSAIPAEFGKGDVGGMMKSWSEEEDGQDEDMAHSESIYRRAAYKERNTSVLRLI